MPRPRAKARVNGPYYDKKNRQWKLRIFEQGRIDRAFASMHEAEAAKRAIAAQLEQGARRGLEDVLEEYLRDKAQRGKASVTTCHEQGRCLRQFLAHGLSDEITQLTPQRAAMLYRDAVERTIERTGRPRAAATHRLDLTLAKSLFAWSVRKGYVAENPFRAIEPTGRVSAGKAQLRLGEAKRYRDVALRLFDENRDVMALAAVVPLYLGLRSSELLRRRVRDVDAGGSLLWIDGGKTKNARRQLQVTAPALQQRLIRLTQDRAGDALLFGDESTRQPRPRQALHAAVKRICQLAQVPQVCPHSLRGLFATLSIESGAAASAVASALGHGSFAVTAKHYAQPEAVADAQSVRVASLLAELDALSAEQIVARLSPDKLAQIVSLIKHRSESVR
jgi:integrase